MSKTIAVLGAGTMGAGITQVAATAGYEVRLYDLMQGLVDEGLGRIYTNLTKAVEKGKLTIDERAEILNRIDPLMDIDEVVTGAELVIEAVPERMAMKQQLAKRVTQANPAAVFASNTSSLSISQIATAAVDPSMVIGMHFFNPVHLMPLLEIVRGERTSDATLALAQQVGADMGREMIVVRDAPGFATSRLGLVIGLEAMRMFEQGVASAQDIDRAMELGYRHPMGPLKLTDLVGLDVRLAIAEHLHSELGAAFEPPQVLRQMVADGKLGKKSGQGFYSW